MGRARALAVFAVLVGLAAISPSCGHPDYGETPFLCGSQGECPEGYGCKNAVCVRNGSPTQGDASPDTMTSGGAGGSSGAGGVGGGTGGVGGTGGFSGTGGVGGIGGAGGIGGIGGIGGAGGAGGIGGIGGVGGIGGSGGSGMMCQTNAQCTPPQKCCLFFFTCGDPMMNPFCIPSPI